MSSDLKLWLRRATAKEEFVVPPGFFDEQERQIQFILSLDALKNDDEFAVPENYFASQEESILNEVREGNEAFFSTQQHQILAQIKLDEAVGNKEEFTVPHDYFERAESAILARTTGSKKGARVIPMYATGHARMWYAIAAAACIAFVLVMVWPQTNEAAQPSFAELLQNTEVTEDDMDWFASDEDYYDLFMSEIELLTDTTIVDTNSVFQKALPDAEKPEINKENKKTAPVKPTDKKKPLTWDDITDEELLEYLLEEGDEDLLDEL